MSSRYVQTGFSSLMLLPQGLAFASSAPKHNSSQSSAGAGAQEEVRKVGVSGWCRIHCRWIQVTSSKSHRNKNHCIMLVRDSGMVEEGEARCCITFYKHLALLCFILVQ